MVNITARQRLQLLAGGAAFALTGCGGSDAVVPEPIVTSTPVPVQPPAPTPTTSLSEGMLRNTFRNNFSVGAALTANQINDNDLSVQLAREQFNMITPEYELKADQLTTSEGVYNFDAADRVVDWALENGLSVRGHALVWHEATPSYFLEGSRNEIRARLEAHVQRVVSHYRGRVAVWDVANEVTSVDIFNGDNGVGPDRRSNWYNAVGNADYIDWAFIAARAADPDALLFLSDYETENAFKMNWTMDIVRRLLARGVPIDGVGQQFHLNLNTDPADVLTAIDTVENEFAGLINHVTELDISFYQDPGTCWQSGVNCLPDLGANPPADMLAAQAQIMRDIFTGLALRSSVESVNVWGVRDGDSWLNFVPAARYNHPLLYDRNGEPKPALLAIVDPAYQI